MFRRWFVEHSTIEPRASFGWTTYVINKQMCLQRSCVRWEPLTQREGTIQTHACRLTARDHVIFKHAELSQSLSVHNTRHRRIKINVALKQPHIFSRVRLMRPPWSLCCVRGCACDKRSCNEASPSLTHLALLSLHHSLLYASFPPSLPVSIPSFHPWLDTSATRSLAFQTVRKLFGSVASWWAGSCRPPPSLPRSLPSLSSHSPFPQSSHAFGHPCIESPSTRCAPTPLLNDALG